MLQCLKWLNFDNLQIYINTDIIQCFGPCFIKMFSLNRVRSNTTSVLEKYNNCFASKSNKVGITNLDVCVLLRTRNNKYEVEIPLITKRGFYTISAKMSSSKRIGPHNIDIISIIVGSTLGDTHLEKRTNGKGTRVIFEQSNKNVEYLMWFHSYLANRGYCSTQTPKLHKRIRKNGEIFFHYRINSYTFSSFNWLHDMFYKLDSLNSLVTDKENNLSVNTSLPSSLGDRGAEQRLETLYPNGLMAGRQDGRDKNILVKRYVKVIPANLE